jgi:hypothetical protein
VGSNPTPSAQFIVIGETVDKKMIEFTIKDTEIDALFDVVKEYGEANNIEPLKMGAMLIHLGRAIAGDVGAESLEITENPEGLPDDKKHWN